MRTVRSTAAMRFAKIGYILVSLALCVLGILLIAVPEFSISALGIICGVILIVFGVIRVVGYFSKDLYRLAFQYDLAFGVILIAIGVLMLVNPGSLMNFICVTLGIFILADSLYKVRIALDSKKFGLQTWWLILIFAVIAGELGLILMFRPGASSHLLIVLLGIAMLAEGIMNFSTVITAVKIIKHQRPDVIEIDYYEESEE